MTAAIVALSLAVAAAISGLIALAIKAIGAERRSGDARADASGLAKSLESVTKQRDDADQRADDERKRADALDSLLAEMATTGPVDGAFDRLLAKWQASRARRDDPAAVPAPSSTPATNGDELLRPGD